MYGPSDSLHAANALGHANAGWGRAEETAAFARTKLESTVGRDVEEKHSPVHSLCYGFLTVS